jgi:hypothetical protein
MNAAAQKKYFTVDEANQTLPLVRAIVSDIVELAGTVDDRRERLDRFRQGASVSNSDEQNPYDEEREQFEEELKQDIARLQEFAEELSKLGAELKDPRTGLVDFPMKLDGREVLLCWRHGEEEIGFWHEVDAGFQGRQSLLESSLFGEDSTDDEST